MQPSHLVLWIVGLALLAGCVDSGGGAPNSSATPTPGGPPLTATAKASSAIAGEETGAISVLVVTTELQPVPTAQVLLADTEFSAFTDAAGAVTFNDVAPGTYTALAAKPGYNPREDKGRVVDVVAGEVAEVKLTLDPVPVTQAESAYYATTPLSGFIGCGIEGAPGTVGWATYCGRGLQTPVGTIKDPNDKTLFEVLIDNIQIRSVVLEGHWVPNNDLTGPQLRMIWAAQLQCGATGSCLNTANAHINVGGHSPLYGVDHEGTSQRLTNRFGQDPVKYPSKSYVETRAYCQTNCTLVGVPLQQEFDVWITMFYGKEASPEFRAVPD